ncbi:MAG: LysR family transcriptional regulator [Chiayiivirga sp.]|jgi:DNA-binding transcriptional LysR family regulator|uniref:LysR family transcriptional regulator n=1 Tax=Chiayiivirga sp. TaxID=2041042 RepID=UPI0025C4D9A4|nr:LysR family transcriptional regulator [Chiayiivirga sp.]MCI1711649.1 LysR family transcriptional regulator [Chiayiivirga sp.]MCI1729776.1 LysR family transcriptional regulator [Chiayiivirga sp.]
MSELLSDIEVFVASAEAGQLAHAARVLGITPAGASAALKRLEGGLGVRLMLRTTRKLRLTQEGERYLPHARQVLAALREGRVAVANEPASIGGLLRIAAPADFGRNRLMARLLEFAARHPAVRFQVALDDAIADFFSTPVDLALRYGKLGDSRLIAQTLAELPRVLCAAPQYLARRGMPAHPDELREHDTLCYMQQQRAVDRWPLHRGDERVEIEVAPRWVFNDAEMVRRCATRGMGIAYRIRSDIEDDLAAGRLQRVLPDWDGEPVPLSLVYPDRALSPALRALISFLGERAPA